MFIRKVTRNLPKSLLRICIAICLFSSVTVNAEEKRIGMIAFFGQEGFDTAAIRRVLPFNEGDAVSLGNNEKEGVELRASWKESAKQALRQFTGRNPTDVERVCCSSSGDVLVYIGLPGPSSHAVRYNRPPKGTLRLPQVFADLDDQIGQSLMKAILEGRGGEDDSEGYALSKDPATREKQLKFRDEARKNETQVFRVLESSAKAEQRAVAAEALGYVQQSRQQITALVKASFDANDEVRNNAARAIGVLLNSKPELRHQVPVKPFIDLLSSGTWTDRNKGLMVVFAMASGRDPIILSQLRSQAGTSLIEMAQWYKGHAFAARMILGWIAGIEDKELQRLAEEEPPEALLRAFRAQHH